MNRDFLHNPLRQELTQVYMQARKSGEDEELSISRMINHLERFYAPTSPKSKFNAIVHALLNIAMDYSMQPYSARCIDVFGGAFEKILLKGAPLSDNNRVHDLIRCVHSGLTWLRTGQHTYSFERQADPYLSDIWTVQIPYPCICIMMPTGFSLLMGEQGDTYHGNYRLDKVFVHRDLPAHNLPQTLSLSLSLSRKNSENDNVVCTIPFTQQDSGNFLTCNISYMINGIGTPDLSLMVRWLHSACELLQEPDVKLETSLVDPRAEVVRQQMLAAPPGSRRRRKLAVQLATFNTREIITVR